MRSPRIEHLALRVMVFLPVSCLYRYAMVMGIISHLLLLGVCFFQSIACMASSWSSPASWAAAHFFGVWVCSGLPQCFGRRGGVPECFWRCFGPSFARMWFALCRLCLRCAPFAALCLENCIDGGAGVTVAVVWSDIYCSHFGVAASVSVLHANVGVVNSEHVPYRRCLVCSVGALGFSTGVYPTWQNVKIEPIVGGLSCYAV